MSTIKIMVFSFLPTLLGLGLVACDREKLNQQATYEEIDNTLDDVNDPLEEATERLKSRIEQAEKRQ